MEELRSAARSRGVSGRAHAHVEERTFALCMTCSDLNDHLRRRRGDHTQSRQSYFPAGDGSGHAGVPGGAPLRESSSDGTYGTRLLGTWVDMQPSGRGR